MEYTVQLNLPDFNFWGGAKQHEFTYNELKELEYTLEELYPKGCSESDINDLFWFEEEFLCNCIGLNYDEYLDR